MCGNRLTQVLWRPTGVLYKPILQLGQVEVADDNLGVLQAVVVNQVLKLKDSKEDSFKFTLPKFDLTLVDVNVETFPERDDQRKENV